MISIFRFSTKQIELIIFSQQLMSLNKRQFLLHKTTILIT